jgi:superfamily I DNA and/or RNA helicase
VAITRAKRKLIVVGNSATLNTNPTYKKFIKTAIYN